MPELIMEKYSTKDKIINFIMRKDKIKERYGFRYGKFLARWSFLHILILLVGTIGFAYIPEVFESPLHPILMSLFVVFTFLGIYVSIRFYLMNKKLNVLKINPLNFFMSFFWLVFITTYSIALICATYFIPQKSLFLNMKGAYVFLLMPLIIINWGIFLPLYFIPIIEVLHSLENQTQNNSYNNNRFSSRD